MKRLMIIAALIALPACTVVEYQQPVIYRQHPTYYVPPRPPVVYYAPPPRGYHGYRPYNNQWYHRRY